MRWCFSHEALSQLWQRKVPIWRTSRQLRQLQKKNAGGVANGNIGKWRPQGKLRSVNDSAGRGK